MNPSPVPVFQLSMLSIGSLATAVLLGVLAAYLISIKKKPRALWFLIAHFCSISFLSFIYFWRYSFFHPSSAVVNAFSDTFIFGIVAFLWFALHYSTTILSLGSKIAGWTYSGLALLAFLYRFFQPPVEVGFSTDSHFFTLDANPFLGTFMALGYVLAVIVLFGKARRFSKAGDGLSLSSYWKQRAQACRSFALFTLMSLAIAITYLPFSLDLISSNTFQIVFTFGSLITSLAMFVSYMNHAIVPVSFRQKLTGIMFAIIMLIVGFTGTFVLFTDDADFHQTRRQEAEKLLNIFLEPEESNVFSTKLLETGSYIAVMEGSRNGQEGAVYNVLASAGDIDSADLKMSDATMAQRSEAIWGDALAEASDSGHYLRYIDPMDTGSFYDAYSFFFEGEMYEVGFAYAVYRSRIHQTALIFFWLIIFATPMILFAIPLFFARSVLIPLTKLLEGVEHMESGNLEVKVEHPSYDELGRLTGAFNKMASSLSATIHSLEGKHRQVEKLNANLEATVLERTELIQRLQKEIHIRGEAEKAKDYFLANMSHELRTPLNGLVGVLGLINPVTDEEQEFMEIAQESAYKLRDILDGVLRLSSMKADATRATYTQVNLDQELETIVGQYRTHAQEKGLLLVLEKGDAPCFIQTDRSALSQIIRNLVSNAVKFSDSGIIKVHYRVAEKLHIVVEDQGIGIPQEELHKIFELFQQLENPYTKTRPGTGAGLALAHALCAEIGGEITVDSQSGRGSQFTVSLPIIEGCADHDGGYQL